MYDFITSYPVILIIQTRFQKGSQYEKTTLGILLKELYAYIFTLPQISHGTDPDSLK